MGERDRVASLVPSRFVPSGVLLLSAGAVVLFAPVVRADSTSPSASVTRPVVYLQAGFSTASPHMRGATAGGSVILHPDRRLAIEGSGAYLDRGEGSSALSLSAGLIVNLVSTEEKAVPYLVAGGGLFRASFDTRNARFSGPAPSGEMGTGRYRHVMEGEPPGWDLGELPPFYSDRVETLIAREGRSGRGSFNDPALSAGAGVRIRLGRSWSARQDARAQLLMRRGEVYTVWVFTIHVGRGF